MSSIVDRAPATAAPNEEIREGRPWLLLAAVVVPLVTVWLVMALAIPLPAFEPDEFLYERLARSVAAGHGLAIRGDGIGLRSALYVYLITPMWWLASGFRAYDLARVEGVLLICATAAPVWWLARRLVGDVAAVLVTACTLAGTWMVEGASIMTETVALPLATASLVAAVEGLRRPSQRLGVAALVLALLASWARLQCLVLVPAIAVALAVDAARCGSGWRERLRAQRAPAIAVAVLLAVAALVALVAGKSAVGSYSGLLSGSASANAVLHHTARQLLAVVLVSGFVPALLLPGIALRRSAWRDPDLGPLLAVLVPAVIAFVLQSGFFVARVGAAWTVERYVMYPIPLLLVFAFAVARHRGFLDARTLAIAAIVSPLLLLAPAAKERTEERALFSTVERVQGLVPGLRPGGAVFALAIVLLAAVALMARRARGAQPVALGLAALLLVVLVAQTVTAWSWERQMTWGTRHTLPSDLAWVDHHRDGPVSLLDVGTPSPNTPYADLFNAGLARYYSQNPIPDDGACSWSIARDGTAQFRADCQPPSGQFLLADDSVHLTFYDEVRSVDDPAYGRLVTVRGQPRVMTYVLPPCDRILHYVHPVTLKPWPASKAGPCRPALQAALWLPQSGTVEVTFRGAPQAQHVALAFGRRYPIPPGRSTTIRVPITNPTMSFAINLDWSQSGSLNPKLTNVDLVMGGRRRSLL